MLLKLTNRISECLSRAADARSRTNAVIDARVRADLLAAEAHWLRLVDYYKLLEEADHFLEDCRAARLALEGTLPNAGALVITCPVTGKEFSSGILTDETSFARLSQELIFSRCPHCGADHPWWTKDAKLVAGLVSGAEVEFTKADAAKTNGQGGLAERPVRIVDSAALGALVRAAIDNADADARAAFYVADGNTLHHVIGMPKAYAQHVDGFVISPDSLACGLAASIRQPIITCDVVEEPRWKPWLWLAQQFEYRACWSFPVETPKKQIVGTFAMYFRDPHEATARDLDLATTITRTAALIMAPQHGAR